MRLTILAIIALLLAAIAYNASPFAFVQAWVAVVTVLWMFAIAVAGTAVAILLAELLSRFVQRLKGNRR